MRLLTNSIMAVVILTTVVAIIRYRTQGALFMHSVSAESPVAAVGPACELSPDQLAKRRLQLIPGLFQRAQQVEDISNGLRFTFTSEPGLLADLAKIMEQERDCCSFLRIQLTMEPSEGPVTLEVTGPEGTGEMLRKL